MHKVIDTIVVAGPDAIQLSPGHAKILQAKRGAKKPALVFRTDIANVYGKELPNHMFSHLITNPLEQAITMDAACVVVNILFIPGKTDLYHQCIKNASELKPLCERFGMPLMIEPLVMQPNEKFGGYMVDGDLSKILPLVRQAVELGADIIKADPCDNIEEYHRVIEVAAGVPVLVRGGGKASEEEILTRTKLLMLQGAAGIVYGRNVIQHENPRNMTRALMAIVHDGVTVDDAMAILRGRG
jgi:DhnA family fructose-bisphosphate aldolase class Ia